MTLEHLDNDPKNSNRWFFIWLASYLFAGVLLFFYFGIPLLPILLSGAVTLIVTFIKFRSK